MKIKLSYGLIAIILIAWLGCEGGKKNSSPTDTPTAGEIIISADETLLPIVDAEVAAFEGIYTNAKIHVRYRPENLLMQDLSSDTVRLLIISRPLTEEEKKFCEEKKMNPAVTKIALDAVALITNNENRDTMLTLAQVQDILTGKISKWKQINFHSANEEIQIVFDNKNSSTVRYLTEMIQKQPLSKKSFAANSNPEVIDYVAKNKNAIGIIGVSWISDRDDTVSRGFLKKVRVMGIAPSDTSKGAGDFYQPYQAYIAQKFYPLWRYVYVINQEGRAGLGTGFVSFMAGDKGQRVVLKSGLVPVTMPVRIVEIK